jgi:hypothetical protein
MAFRRSHRQALASVLQVPVYSVNDEHLLEGGGHFLRFLISDTQFVREIMKIEQVAAATRKKV